MDSQIAVLEHLIEEGKNSTLETFAIQTRVSEVISVVKIRRSG